MNQISFKRVIFTLFSALVAFGLFHADFAYAEGDTNEGTPPSLSDALQEFKMKVENDGRARDGVLTYRLSPVDASLYPKSQKFEASFNERELGSLYPISPTLLKGKTLLIRATTDVPVGETATAVLNVKDWSLYDGNSSYVSEKVTVTGIHFQEGEYIQYEVEPFTDSGLERITFKKSTLGGNFPTDNLVNAALTIVGPYATSDKKELAVQDWLILSSVETEKEVIKSDTYQIHGHVSPYLFEEVVDDQLIFWAELVDYDGKKYMTRWNKSNLPSFRQHQLEGEYTLEVSTITPDAKKPIVEVIDFTKQADNYEFKTDEVISVVGEVGGLVNSHASRYTYKFAANGKTYYAVFDSEVVGSNSSNSKLSGKSLELTGVVNKQGNLIYLGVVGYRDPYADSNYGKETSPANPNVKIENIKATPVYLVSYGEDASAYRVVTSQGIEHTFVFDKKMLKTKFPTNNIIGQEFDFVVWFDSSTQSQNAYLVASLNPTGEQGFEQDRGKFLKVVEQSQSATIFNFESIQGGTYKVLVNSASVAKMGGSSKVVGQTATIYGNFSTGSGERIFDAYMITPVNVPHVNTQENEVVSFTGKVQKISSRDPKGITLYATNQYGQSEYLYIETDFLKDKFPASIPLEDIVSHEITVTGYRMNNGTLIVSNFGFPKVPDYYPNEIKAEIQAPEYFPNMKGFTGILDISDIGGSHLMLITSTDKYILNGTPEVMEQIENNLRNIVYLRGEYREAGSPYWTGEIKVYDIKPIDSNTNTIKNPIGEPVHDLIPDPDKDAHHTLQPHEKPEEFDHGSAIPEAKYFPEIPKIEVDAPIMK